MTCMQKALLNACNCYDYHSPYDHSAEAYDELDDNYFREVCSNDTAETTDRSNVKSAS